MARTTELKQEQINDICRTMEENNIKPTVERVRAECGKGSRTTINRMLREYEKTRDVINSDVTISKETEMILRRLHRSIETGYIEKIKEFEKEIIELKSKTDTYLSENQEYLEEVNNLKFLNQNLSGEARVERTKADDAKEVILKLQTEIEDLRDVKSTNRVLTDQNKGFNKTIDQNKKQIEDLIQRATTAETKLEMINKK